MDFTWIGSPATTMSGVQPAPGYVDLSGIAALKGIPVGTTVTIRYYASGQTTNGQWGFGANGLEVYGAVIPFTSILLDPVRPAGADFVFNGCARDTPTTIHFTLYGRGQAGRVFTAKLLRLVGTHEDPNVDGGIVNDYTIVADIGTLVSDSIAGTILCRIPDAPDGTYVIGVSYDSTILFDHYSSYSCQFAIRHTGLVEYRFTGNGDWSNPANWLNGFVPPLVIPCGVEVIITTTGSGSCIVYGDITVLEGGMLTITPGSRLEVRP